MWKNKLKELIYLIENSDVNEIEATFWGRKYRVVKKSPTGAIMATPGEQVVSSAAPEMQPDSEQPIIISGHEVKSPMPGTFYMSPAPDATPYVKIGDRVEKGDSLCIVEAMKIMNEIESGVSGVVKEVLVENGKAVEFNQPLFRIE